MDNFGSQDTAIEIPLGEDTSSTSNLDMETVETTGKESIPAEDVYKFFTGDKEEKEDKEDKGVNQLNKSVKELAKTSKSETGKTQPVKAQEKDSIPPEELKRGYMRQQDYSKKTAEVATQRKSLEQTRAALVQNKQEWKNYLEKDIKPYIDQSFAYHQMMQERPDLLEFTNAYLSWVSENPKGHVSDFARNYLLKGDYSNLNTGSEYKNQEKVKEGEQKPPTSVDPEFEDMRMFYKEHQLEKEMDNLREKIGFNFDDKFSDRIQFYTHKHKLPTFEDAVPYVEAEELKKLIASGRLVSREKVEKAETNLKQTLKTTDDENLRNHIKKTLVESGYAKVKSGNTEVMNVSGRPSNSAQKSRPKSIEDITKNLVNRMNREGFSFS